LNDGTSKVALLDVVAKQFMEERGDGRLAKTSKLHFRTALRV
jgi:ribonuclease HIII